MASMLSSSSFIFALAKYFATTRKVQRRLEGTTIYRRHPSFTALFPVYSSVQSLKHLKYQFILLQMT